MRYSKLSSGLSWTALLLVMGIVLVRATVMIPLRDASPETAGPQGPGPVSSLALDLLALLPSALMLLRSYLVPQIKLHWQRSDLILPALALLGVASTLWASDKFAAFLTATTLLAAASLLWSTQQLVREWSTLRIIAGLLLGLLLTFAARGVIYQTIELPDLREFWTTQERAKTFQQRGWDPDSFIAKQFDRKVLAGEMMGFMSSANTFAAAVGLTMLVTLGLAWQKWRSERDGRLVLAAGIALVPGLWILLGPGILAAINGGGLSAFSGSISKTALASFTLGLVLLIALGYAGETIRKHRRVLVWLTSVAIVVGILAFVAIGLSRNGIPQDSLNFRWRYWVGSAGVFRETPLLGTGLGNFGAAYLRHRLPQATEEIRDPHNFLVSMYTQLGLVGGLIATAWVMTLSLRLVRTLGTAAYTTMPAIVAQPIWPLRRLAMFTVAGSLAALIVSTDLAADPSFAGMEILKRLIMGVLMLGAFVIAMIRGTHQENDSREAPLLLGAMTIGLLMMLLHSMVDFVLAEPGTLMLFAMTAGAVLGVRVASHEPVAASDVEVRLDALAALRQDSKGSIGLLAGGLGLIVAIVAVAGAVLVPIALADHKSREAFANMQTGGAGPWTAAEQFNRAGQLSLLTNSEHALHESDAYLRQRWSSQATEAADKALSLDPANSLAMLRLANAYEMRGEFPKAIEAYKRAQQADPMDLVLLTRVADLLVAQGYVRDATKLYRNAIWIDNKLDATEPERLSRDQRSRIEAWIGEHPVAE